MSRAAVLLLVAIGLGVGLVIQKLEPWKAKQVVIFTPDQLSAFDGSKGGKLYLGIMGEIYDVSAGSRFYSKGKGYHHFVGRDATRAFVTGEFMTDLTDDVKDFQVDQAAGIVHWRGFFRNHTEYKFKARLAGAFYDATGQPLPELARIEELAAQAKSAEERMRELEAQYPRCNSRWNQASGGYVWCDGGMYPRKIISQIAGGKPTSRCACFAELGWSDIRQVYADCDPQATECRTTPPGPSAGVKSLFKKPNGNTAQLNINTATDTTTDTTTEVGADTDTPAGGGSEVQAPPGAETDIHAQPAAMEPGVEDEIETERADAGIHEEL